MRDGSQEKNSDRGQENKPIILEQISIYDDLNSDESIRCLTKLISGAGMNLALVVTSAVMRYYGSAYCSLPLYAGCIISAFMMNPDLINISKTRELWAEELRRYPAASTMKGTEEATVAEKEDYSLWKNRKGMLTYVLHYDAMLLLASAQLYISALDYKYHYLVPLCAACIITASNLNPYFVRPSEIMKVWDDNLKKRADQYVSNELEREKRGGEESKKTYHPAGNSDNRNI